MKQTNKHHMCEGAPYDKLLKNTSLPVSHKRGVEALLVLQQCHVLESVQLWCEFEQTVQFRNLGNSTSSLTLLWHTLSTASSLSNIATLCTQTWLALFVNCVSVFVFSVSVTRVFWLFVLPIYVLMSFPIRRQWIHIASMRLFRRWPKIPTVLKAWNWKPAILLYI